MLTITEKIERAISYAKGRLEETGKHYMVSVEGHACLDCSFNRKAWDAIGLAMHVNI